jgi:hypothetical protein
VRNLVEASIDIGSGFIIALLIQFYIFPLFGLYPTVSVGIKLALIFTIVSILRSWFWRTLFKRI